MNILMTLKIYTLEALATELDVSYQYLRKVLGRYQRGEIASFKGYKFFGEHNKAWYAYSEDADLQIVKAEKGAGEDR
jgi:hypothetical protein